MDKILYIVRGVPGSGKTTFAKQLTSNAYEADQYFVDENGDYKFDFTKLRDAHKECQNNVRMAMMSSTPKIAVSNTFTEKWEMEIYFNLAKEYGYTVFSIIVENRHGGLNQHGVPDDKIRLMKSRFEVKL